MANNVIHGKMIPIGNSEGIRIPKSIREQLGLIGNIEMEIVGGELRVRPEVDEDPRAGWEESFREMAANGDDKLVWPEDMSSTFDEEEWEW